MRVLSVILFLIGSVAESLKLYRVHVPHYKLDGEDAVLECEFDLGRARLYAVKWYKDNEEFFRYVPRFNPPIYTHRVDGVDVDSLESNAKIVKLKKVSVRSTGVYRCEVSAEAPSFSSGQGEGRMTVVYLPKEGPQITGIVQDEYEVGDTLDLNCTSSKSFPPAKISWYINDLPVEVPWVVSFQHEPPQPQTESGNGKSPVGNSLMASTLRLRLQLAAHHFGSRGNAKVRCVASISTPLWQDGDEKVVGNSRKTNDKDFPFEFGVGGDLPNFPETQSPRVAFFDSKEALVQIRGSSTNLLISLQLLTMTPLILWFLS